MLLIIRELQKRMGMSAVFVTHDQDEALSMASRIAVMNKGEVAQLATPSDLYEYPADRFVAEDGNRLIVISRDLVVI